MTDEELRQQFQTVQQSLSTLIENVKDSLEREIADVRTEVTKVNERIDRMDARLDKIAAGAHYVTRLVEWSETQDKFQADILRRVQSLEDKVYRPKP